VVAKNNKMKNDISHRQFLKDAPKLIDYAIIRGWMSRPKPKQDADGTCSTDAISHLDDDEIQEPSKQRSRS
jgi:hypothetical protein